jgi:hypothetical protein
VKALSLIPKKLVLPVFCLLALLSAVHAAPDSRVYQTSDLLLYFRNPAGFDNNDRVVVFSLGSTWNVFRRAATPTDPTYGTVISLGNIGDFLSSDGSSGGYGLDWSELSDTIWVGAVGQNGPLDTGTASVNGDYARTVYISKARFGAGDYQQANSDPLTRMGGSAAGQNSVAVAVTGSGGPFLDPTTSTTPRSNPNEFTANIVLNNPIVSGSLGNGYSLYQGGVMAQISSEPYNYGEVTDVVAALDIYRQTPVLNAEGWQNINNIDGVVAREGYYLGTVTLSSNGAVHFVGRADGTPQPPDDDYTAWAEGYPDADLTDKQGDYDKDGFKNVDEYAFGTDPTIGNSALSSATVVSNNLTVGFFRRSTANDQAPAYAAFSSTDLANAFTNNGASISILTNVAPAGYQAASVTQPVSGSKIFYRIKATLPQEN